MRTDNRYNHTLVEKKWQDEWRRSKLYTPDIDKPEKPFYNLFMFPYPSAEGLHAGHTFSSTGSDVYGRFMRMNGNSVFQPIGYDSFGIHSENYALKIGEKPQKMLERTTKHYEAQLRSLGHGYDWTRTVTTSDPDYYRWTQWLFLKMWEKGLAYRKKAKVNWCPTDKTVLSDEQVMTPIQAGKEPKDVQGNTLPMSDDLKVCERCGTVIEEKELEQWFFKITEYADRLLSGLGKIDWSERVVQAQRNWIGKSEGMLIDFTKENGGKMTVYTTRPDTLNAATFLVISDDKLYNERTAEKVGEDTHEFAINPLNDIKLPIWKANYVAPGYGTGVVMGVPAHDERDRAFAEKYHLDIVTEEPNSLIGPKAEKEGWGKKHTNYHLRDWLVSRQRYWGAPIPMIRCDKDGWQPVPEKELPVLLPDISDYKPEGTGKGPLANHPDFYKTKCPKCGGEATRETDVMDTFVDSSWYFLRYPSVGSASAGKMPFDTEITKHWLPVNLYFGGAEHSVLHLMYARFATMVLHDLKLVDFDEPFPKFFAHGLMIKDGAKMSKSRGNVVNPDEYVAKFGADTLRLYVMFLGPMDASPDFRDSGIEGMQRFVNKLWNIFDSPKKLEEKNRHEVYTKLHQTIKKVTENMKDFKYNTAIASIMELVNSVTAKGSDIDILKNLCLMLAPFAPHFAEEVWVEVLGQKFSVHKSAWPKYDAKYLKVDQIKMVIQINGKVRGTLELESRIAEQEEKVTSLVKKEENIAKWLKGVEIRKVVFIPGKLINFVI